MSDTALLMFEDAPAAPDHVNVMAFGPPGSGKSTFAATAPGPILWLNLEGPGALAYARKTAAHRGTQILEVRIDKDTDPAATMDLVYQHVRKGLEPAPQTVVVDTIGKLREALIKVMVRPGAKDSLQQFGRVAEKLGGFIVALRDLPVHVVVLAHEDVSEGEQGDRIIRPLIGGKLTETVQGEVDVLTYCSAVREEDAVRYYGQLVEARGRRAKDRSGGLGTHRPLDLSEWIVAYRAALTPDNTDLPFDPDAPAGEAAGFDPAASAAVDAELARQETLA